jgi:hypothetical protein
MSDLTGGTAGPAGYVGGPAVHQTIDLPPLRQLRQLRQGCLIVLKVFVRVEHMGGNIGSW